jgi:hypothetical protein
MRRLEETGLPGYDSVPSSPGRILLGLTELGVEGIYSPSKCRELLAQLPSTSTFEYENLQQQESQILHVTPSLHICDINA